MAKQISKKAAMDDAVKGLNMKQLTEKVADAKTPAPIRAAAKRRLDRLSGADNTAPASQMSKGGKATKKVPVISIGIGMAEMPKGKGKAKMMRGGMSGGKEHMYSAGGMVKDNPGLKALKAASPEAYNKITKS
jgi:hypothetical protein